MPPTWLVVNGDARLARGGFESHRRAASVVAASALVEARARDRLERREARRHRDRVAGERAGLVDGPERRDAFHDVAAPAVRADRHAAADDLAERGEVGRDAVERLRAAERDAEAGHDLVEDQQRAVPRAELAQRLAGIPAAGGTQPMLPATGSTMTRRSRRRSRRSTPRALRGRCRRASWSPPRPRRARPAESGTPSVSAPEPALTSSASAWPW